MACHSIHPAGDLFAADWTDLFVAVYSLDVASDHVRVPEAFAAFRALMLDLPQFVVDADMASGGVSLERPSRVRLR